MTTAEPFKPNPSAGDDRPAAADPGQGAPPPAEGFGTGVEDSDDLEARDDRGDDHQ